MPENLKRELIWLGVALLVALVVFPLLVYATGMLTLGPYSGGGAGRFLAAYLKSLVGLEWQAIALAVAPLAAILGWRLARTLRAPRPDDEYVGTRTHDGAAVRREPTL